MTARPLIMILRHHPVSLTKTAAARRTQALLILITTLGPIRYSAWWIPGRKQRRNSLSEERRLLKLNVVNHGQIYFGQYFTHISKGLRNPYDGIVYGGAKLVRRYGRGFLMAFFDEYEEKPVKLYVSKEIMSRSRFGHYVDEILNTADVRYFRVFLLNPDISESDINGFRVLNLEVKKLRQLAIYFELNLSTEEDPTSLPK